MKKLIASLLVLAFGVNIVMAEGSIANYVSYTYAGNSTVGILSPCTDDTTPMAINPFADIAGQSLTDEEAAMVEGEGPITGAVGGAIIGGVASGIYESIRTAYRMVSGKEKRSGTEIGRDIGNSMKSGAITGAAVGVILPSF